LAKKGKGAGAGKVAVVALAAAAEDTSTRVFEVPPGGTVDVIVDVGQMSVPYAVRYGGATVIKSLVDRAAALNLLPGDHKLVWSFIHQVKGWTHTIGISINNGTPTVLESKSEAKKDPDVSADFVVIRA
jgi:hypothetical protein